jgi:RNA polymerase sigma-70 factor (ECF subfamily)
MDGSGSLAAGLTATIANVDEQLARDFEARLSECATLAFRLAYSVLRHRQDAEDVAQEAFAKAYRNFRQLRDRERFRAWLARMTWRMALDRQRANRRRLVRESVVDDQPVDRPAPDELVARERADALWQAIDALPDKLRIVVVLANMDGHDIADVAALLSIPIGTVKSRLFDARQKLREQLQWMQNGTAQ